MLINCPRKAAKTLSTGKALSRCHKRQGQGDGSSGELSAEFSGQTDKDLYTLIKNFTEFSPRILSQCSKDKVACLNPIKIQDVTWMGNRTISTFSKLKTRN